MKNFDHPAYWLAFGNGEIPPCDLPLPKEAADHIHKIMSANHFLKNKNIELERKLLAKEKQLDYIKTCFPEELKSIMNTAGIKLAAMIRESDAT